MATNIPSPTNSVDFDAPYPLDIIARVTFYTKSRSSAAKGKKAKTTTTKETRAKEFSHLFADTEVNYHTFLQKILDNHHLDDKYKVNDQVVFPCKVQVPPATYVTLLSPFFVLTICYRASSKSDATYVVNFDEFKALATKINKKTVSRAIIVFVEMPEVEKAFSKASIVYLHPRCTL